jgi:L-2,4-diaminobutyric acid acetyltransferase
MLGFMMGFRYPRKQDTYFVWQVGVRAEARGHNVAGRLLYETAAANKVQFVEATVTPGNDASRKFFTKFAESVNAPIRWQPCFRREDFPPHLPHDPEDLLTIGPLPSPLPPYPRS